MKTNDPRSIEEYEAMVRRLRENIYGYVDDVGWFAVRDNWMKPENVRWLKDQVQNQNELANP